MTGFRPYLLILLAYLPLASGPARASLDPSKAITQYVKQVWKSDSGLPQDSALAVTQTADGYLWMGTEEGLVRFDGVHFTVYNKDNTPALRSNAVVSLLTDRDGSLWIGTHGGGLTRFRHGNYETNFGGQWLASQSVQALFQDRAGALWIGTANGLGRYLNNKLQVYTSSKGLADNNVFSICGDNRGDLWIGTQNGLSKLSGGKFTTIEEKAGVGFGAVRVAYADQQGAVWIGGNSGGLTQLGSNGIKRLTTQDGLTSNSVESILRDSAGALWVGTVGGGLDRILDGRVTSYTKNEGFGGSAVQSIFEDREGSLWLGSVGGGLTRFRDGPIKTLSKQEGLVADITLPVYEDKEGAVWIGTVQGLNRLQDGKLSTFTTADGLPDKLIFSVTQTGDGAIWVGTHKGLARLAGNRFVPVEPGSGLPVGAVFCAYTDTDGSLWVGTHGGLSHLEGARFTTYTTGDGLSNNSIKSIHRSADKTLWIGTDGGGLNSLRAGKFKHLTVGDGLAANSLLGLASDKDGTLWMGTRGGGVGRLRHGKVSSYSTQQGLPDDTIFDIIDDQRGRLWMSSNRGIFSVDRAQFEKYDAGAVRKITATVYGVADGMKSRECDGGFQPAALRSRDGRIWIPTVEGVAIADPAHMDGPTAPLTVIIEHVFIYGKEVQFDKPITVAPGNGKLAFSFTAPTFIAPEKVRFRYLLEGFDKDWVQEGTDRTASYTNIPPGEYSFRVLASRDGRKWFEAKSSAAFTLQAHFYQTLGFSALVGVLLAGCALGLHRVRVRHLRESERKLLALVEIRTAELRQSRDELEIRVADRTQDLLKSNLLLEAEVATRTIAERRAAAASDAKTQFLTNMSHEIRTPINGIIGMTDLTLSTQLSDEQRENLEIVKGSADALMLIVNDIMDFAQMESRKLTIDEEPFRLSSIITELERIFEPLTRHKGLLLDISSAPGVPDKVIGDGARVRQVLRNLLDNALKFTAKGGISLHVKADNLSGSTVLLHFTIKDSGIGIPADKYKLIFEAFSQVDATNSRRSGGTGLGLSISSRLAHLMNGSVLVDSEPGVGSTFHFTASLGVVPQLAPRTSDHTSTSAALLR